MRCIGCGYSFCGLWMFGTGSSVTVPPYGSYLLLSSLSFLLACARQSHARTQCVRTPSRCLRFRSGLNECSLSSTHSPSQQVRVLRFKSGLNVKRPRSSVLVRNASVARKYRSCKVSTVQERIHDSNTKCDVHICKELYEFSRYRSCGLNDTSLQSNTKCDVYIRKEILMLCPFTNQVLAQLGLLKFGGKPQFFCPGTGR